MHLVIYITEYENLGLNELGNQPCPIILKNVVSIENV